MSEYSTQRRLSIPPRLPLEGTLDVTYRCNNRCRHCWLRIPADAEEKEQELSFDETTSIVDQARKMGCRHWNIFGGEPMIRPDFAELFDYVTSNSISYTLNTNGSLITPEIARLMTRKGIKLVALYGATADVHDNVTRRPGSFEETMRGMSHLKEAGAGFTVQIVPMKANYRQFKEMISLAQSLSRSWRIGAAWLYLCAYDDPKRNEEIRQQRLAPQDVIELDAPPIAAEQALAEDQEHRFQHDPNDDRLFARCIAGRRDFHIDPYGMMSFCSRIKDPSLRYNVREGSLQECWDEFIPSLADKVRGGKEYLENCGSCDLRDDCRWCPVYGYLEHRRFSAKVEYLCEVAREARRYTEDRRKNYVRYYELAGITVRVESDLPITDDTFNAKFRQFEVDGPGKDNISIKHFSSLPDLKGKDLGTLVYRKPPWAIFKKGNSWIYRSPAEDDKPVWQVAVFSEDHTKVTVYCDGEDRFSEGDLGALTLFPTDQIMLARVLADRDACYLHASGVSLDGKGLLFVGHSEAGKSTMVKILEDHAEILCDDRVIIRRWPEGFKIHGNWSHGEVPIVSSSSAPLKAICFLSKSKENRAERIEQKTEIVRRLLPCLVRPFESKDWWEKALSLVDVIAAEVPCYVLHFDKSGGVVDVLRGI